MMSDDDDGLNISDDSDLTLSSFFITWLPGQLPAASCLLQRSHRAASSQQAERKDPAVTSDWSFWGRFGHLKGHIFTATCTTIICIHTCSINNIRNV